MDNLTETEAKALIAFHKKYATPNGWEPCECGKKCRRDIIRTDLRVYCERDRIAAFHRGKDADKFK